MIFPLQIGFLGASIILEMLRQTLHAIPPKNGSKRMDVHPQNISNDNMIVV
jgi:hypothetical protein